MGCCDSRVNSPSFLPDPKYSNKKPKEISLLLLGPGGSGKSTILKQMSKIYNGKIDNKLLIDATQYIRENIIEDIYWLCTAYNQLKKGNINVLPNNNEYIYNSNNSNNSNNITQRMAELLQGSETIPESIENTPIPIKTNEFVIKESENTNNITSPHKIYNMSNYTKAKTHSSQNSFESQSRRQSLSEYVVNRLRRASESVKYERRLSKMRHENREYKDLKLYTLIKKHSLISSLIGISALIHLIIQLIIKSETIILSIDWILNIICLFFSFGFTDKYCCCKRLLDSLICVEDFIEKKIVRKAEKKERKINSQRLCNIIELNHHSPSASNIPDNNRDLTHLKIPK